MCRSCRRRVRGCRDIRDSRGAWRVGDREDQAGAGVPIGVASMLR